MNLVAHAAVLVAFPVLAAIVTAALVGEIMPELRAEGHLWWTVAGFVLGAVLTLLLGAYGRRTEEEAERARTAPTSFIGDAVTRVATKALPIGMLGAIAIDLLLDGVLVGLGVRLGAEQGLILTIALTLEILFLALSLTTELVESGLSRQQAVLTCAALGLVTAVGAIGAALLLGNVSTSVMSGILGLGAAALLYLVVEELLVEAHEEKESFALSANFFLGFILIYILSSLG